MEKRRQHYVWQHYLEAWATNGQVWCSTRGNTFPASTEKVANERDFYRLKEMSERDFQVVDALIGRMTEPLQALARGWFPHFRVFHDAKRAYEGSGQSNPELEAYLDETINNLEEDLHGSIEQKAIPLLAKLREADTRFLDNDDDATIHFFWFIGMQYMRTPRMARDVVASAREIPGFNAEAAWGLLRTILGTNLAQSYYLRRRVLRLTFLDAPADTEFITGDQPIINVRAVGLPEGQGPAEGELELYYPLTPKRAMLIAFDATELTTEQRSLTAEETTTYNAMIVSKSHQQVYARTEDALGAPLSGRST
jgi:hypothetical protein